MQERDTEERLEEETGTASEPADRPSALEADGDDEPPFDWVVFLIRASALVVTGAMLVTSVDLSRNQGADWLTVLRLAILPFVGAVLLLAAAELIDRRGD